MEEKTQLFFLSTQLSLFLFCSTTSCLLSAVPIIKRHWDRGILGNYIIFFWCYHFFFVENNHDAMINMMPVFGAFFSNKNKSET